MFENDEDWYRMIIEDVLPEDSGTYTCFASNELGETKSVCTLLVYDGRFNLDCFSIVLFLVITLIQPDGQAADLYFVS